MTRFVDDPPLICTGKSCVDRYAAPGTMLCGDCTRRLERQLAETPATLTLLHALHDGRQTPRRSDRPAGTTPSPLNDEVHDLLQHIPAVLASWTQQVCEDRGLRGPDTHDRCPAWLLGQLDWLIQQPWVDDMADEINDFAHAAERLVRVRPHRYRLEPPCPSCAARELGRWDGTEQVDCDACGRAWPEQDYPWMVRLALDDTRGCLTAQEAAQRLGKSVAMVRWLVTRGRIRKLGTIDGLARYSAGDVAQLVEDKEGAA